MAQSHYSQKDPGITAHFSFNNASETNEINGQKAKFVNASHVTDRFGNANSAAFVHGVLGSYLNLGIDKELKPDIGSVALWAKIEVIVYSGKGYQFNPILTTRNGVLDSSGKNEDFCESYGLTYDFRVHRVVVGGSASPEQQVTAHTIDTVGAYEWHHFVFAWDFNYLYLYMDGVLNAKLPKGFKTVYSKTDSVLVGNTGYKKNDRFFCGDVDDIFIYNRVITPGEVENLYNAPDPNRFNYYLKWLKWILLIAFGIGLLVWLILRKFKNDLELQKEKNKINARMNELETKAIRTQMNPHFMFNALNTLQRFILEEDTVNANSYLVKFSGLLRKLLESSAAESISLKEEIEILNNYVEVEKLRFDKSFEFIMSCDIPEPGNVYLPFMLVQPFVENAIWHGLLPKEGKRELKIIFSSLDTKTILCRVIDNGVGREQSFKQKDPFKKRSMAIEFIKQRLELIEKATHINCSFKITDRINTLLQSEGTTVEIIIPILK